MPLLHALSLVYGAGVRLRNSYYDRMAKPFRAGVPVLSVGNLSTGGTGKTPMCLWLFGLFRGRGMRPAVVLRGYSKGGGISDEAELYRRFCGRAAVFTGARRRDSLARICGPDFGVAILDDGFQHRDAGRDFDLVLADATRLPNKDRLLPAGSLREPAEGLGRAHALVLTRCDLAAPAALDSFEAWTAGRWPRLPVFRSLMRPTGCTTLSGETVDPAGRRFFLVCGIGNPGSFLSLAHKGGLAVAGSRFYPDHHDFSEGDFREIRRLAAVSGAEAVLITAKDAQRWRPLEGLPAVVMHISLEPFPLRGGTLEELILRRIAQ